MYACIKVNRRSDFSDFFELLSLRRVALKRVAQFFQNFFAVAADTIMADIRLLCF